MAAAVPVKRPNLVSLAEISTATISDDGMYRYDLVRQWGRGDLVLWIMLNPSVADATDDDRTIRRCIEFARREDASGIAVVNLYAFRTTRPVHLLEAADPVGPENEKAIRAWLSDERVSMVVAAWGAWWESRRHPTRIARPNVEGFARDAGRELVCLGHTKHGSPRHPLYIDGHDPFEQYLGTLVVPS